MSVILPSTPLATQADLDALTARVAKLEQSGPQPVFADDFTTLNVGPNGGSTTWRYVSWYNPPAQVGYAVNQAWMVVPTYSGTPISGLYGATNGAAQLSILKTPSAYAGACGNLPFVSSQIVQQVGPFLTYGRWEARVRSKVIKGGNAAFWLLQTNGAFPPGINIELCCGQDGQPFINFSVNRNGGTDDTQLWNFDFSQFHVYSIEVRADFVTFSVDGKVAYHLPTPAPVGSAPMMILLSNQTAGVDWLGAYDASKLPGLMEIDYVKVFA